MSIASALHSRGYVFLPAYEPSRSGAEVACALGCPIALGSGPAVHVLTPRRKEVSTPNTYSGLFGYGIFPFHTDFAHWRQPPRYLFLRTVVGYTDVPTLITDSAEIIGSVGARILRRAFVRPRRPVNGSMPLLRLYDAASSDQNLVRWDQTFIQPASEAGRLGFARFKDALDKVVPVAVPLAEQGDTLIIDNWRMLHARSAVPEACKDRLLERAYLGDVR